ncbi:MAG TPA: serine/threonine-protein kinase, partial [Gemmatimonadales bacterium]|nr:serine/threonine-protein kinase [Gemmatimonadales bacterium]
MSFSDRFSDSLGPDFTVLRSIGAGGMGEVFEAVDNRLERKVAIKVLKPEQATAVATQRFLREARLMARLKHPCVVKVHSVGEGKGLSWFVMDLVDGETLASRLDRGPLTAKETIQLSRDLLAALAEAHEKGIVHRDIKPANIFIEKGRALISDFGIARTATTSGADAGLTATQQTLGTPAYMSPEQGSGGDVGPASDQYSLALVLYECLSGKRWPQMQSLESGDWSKIPSAVASSLKKAMAFQPAERWADVSAFAAGLQGTRSRRSWYLGGGAAAAAIVTLLWKCPPPTDCKAASQQFSPGINASVPCDRYDGWLAAEKVFATGNWQAADTAYHNLLASNPSCLACDFRLIEVSRWLEQPPDSAQSSALLAATDRFNAPWGRLVSASFEPGARRVERLEQLANDFKAWPLAWYALGTELFNRGAFFGRSRNDAIEALNQHAALDSGFVPAWTDRTLALIAAGDSSAADTAVKRLLSLPRAGGLAQAQRLMAGIAYAFRFTPDGPRQWKEIQKDPSVMKRRELAAGPRFLAGLGSPLGAVEF